MNAPAPQEGSIDVVTEPIEGGVLVRISGDWDTYTSAQVRNVLDKVLGKKPDRLLLDLCKVDFLGTAGISELVLCDKRMKQTDGSLRLFGLQPSVLSALKLTNMDVLFQTFESEKEALK